MGRPQIYDEDQIAERRKEYNKRYREKNKARVQKYYKEYRETNHDKYQKWNNDYYINNRERILIRQKATRLKKQKATQRLSLKVQLNRGLISKEEYKTRTRVSVTNVVTRGYKKKPGASSKYV